MSQHGEWRRVEDGPSFLFRCKSCEVLKRRDTSGRWRYFSDAKTRKNRTACAFRRGQMRHIQQINVLEVTPFGWSYETYSCPPGFGKIERRREEEGFVVRHDGTSARVVLKAKRK